MSTASSKEPVMITAKNVVLRSSEMGGGVVGSKSGGRVYHIGPEGLDVDGHLQRLWLGMRDRLR